MKGAVVGAVLAGGRSRRMGRDKALLEFEGTTLVRRAAAALAEAGAEAVVAVGRAGGAADLAMRWIEDLRPGCGPLGGLETALAWATPRPVLVLACDLPRADGLVVARLLEQARGEAAGRGAARAWLARRGGRLQPLCGLYLPACRAVFADRLDRGERAVRAAVAAVEVSAVDFDDLDRDPFVNVNTPADFDRLAGSAAVP